ncbi:hypothetical protein RirG_107470 [Rhizophagus irregularis DAOM 197198w]|uniref:Uncharacterized protein n=1 Tax=Rhizophagus irregularis (strain DAOM 197198w) TaxID=1432141 RepID=A0A015JLW9_RHIIW|nr:hypothetical protein RirG_107470 [Rhizophagus irregularis DAOM 197198w]
MTAEYTSEGWTRLFNCYSIGEERLNVILQQDILKREKRVAKGRRAKNIGHNKIANMKKSNNNNTKGRGRGGVQHVLPSNIFTTQIQILLMPSNPNNSFDQNINYLNNNLQNIHLNSTQSNPNAEIQNLPNIQAIHSLPDPIQNPQYLQNE